MDRFDILERKVKDCIKKMQKLREEKKYMEKENRRLESQFNLIQEENTAARKLIAQNNILVSKQKKARERIQRLWEHVSHVV